MNAVDDRESHLGIGSGGSRSQRRSARRKAKRRKRARRFYAAVLPVFVVVIAVVALLIVLGGRAEETKQTKPEPSAADAGGATAMAAVLGIRQRDGLPALVLLARSKAGGGVALGMPGMTIIKTDDGFKTLSELYEADKIQPLLTGLNTALGTQAAGLAVVQWADILRSLEQVGSTQQWRATIEDDVGGAGEAARAVAMFVGALVSSPGLWDGVSSSGQSDWMHSFMTAIAPALAHGEWIEAVLPGTLKESAAATFFEPNVAAARGVLAGKANAPASVILEVQNGSGLLEAAQTAGAILESLGFTLAPYANAEGFPDVAATTIMASSDVLMEASEVRDLLGIGSVQEDDSLAPKHIRVVLGKDFNPTRSSGAGG